MESIINHSFKNKKTIILELTEKIQQEGIVISFVKDKTANNLILCLNHGYGKKKIVSPIYKDWIKTTDTFTRQLKAKGVKDDHVLQLVDMLDNNFERVLELDNVGQDDDYLQQQQQQKTHDIRKYTSNGKIHLHFLTPFHGCTIEPDIVTILSVRNSELIYTTSVPAINHLLIKVIVVLSRDFESDPRGVCEFMIQPSSCGSGFSFNITLNPSTRMMSLIFTLNLFQRY